MKSKDTERAKELKEKLESCFKYLEETKPYQSIKEPINIFHIARFINKELYWTYEYISNHEYLTNHDLLNEKIKDLIVNHTQFLLNIIDENLSAENTLKSVINELTNDSYLKEIKSLKKEQQKWLKKPMSMCKSH